ncbi:hypothetical protein [Qipengyuania sp.]|uniref:hypothetical protein n=1 Tax=Qipengyuania sp. TaxID=2004515 RepID=UPI0035164924
MPDPFHQLLNQINGAATSGLHLVAIGMASALPDICASLASEDGRTNAKRYKAWCEANLSGSEFAFLTPEDMYSIRGGVLHQGRFGDLKHNVARVIFTLPGPMSFTNCMMNDAYVYGVVEFCRNLSAAAEVWFEANRNDPIVEANLTRVMRYHPEGLSPYMAGVAVIA